MKAIQKWYQRVVSKVSWMWKTRQRSFVEWRKIDREFDRQWRKNWQQGNIYECKRIMLMQAANIAAYIQKPRVSRGVFVPFDEREEI